MKAIISIIRDDGVTVLKDQVIDPDKIYVTEDKITKAKYQATVFPGFTYREQIKKSSKEE